MRKSQTMSCCLIELLQEGHDKGQKVADEYLRADDSEYIYQRVGPN